ncbi:MAG TPA: hypothetical protein DCX07_08675 [Phycisphaerales bacterium]|nr:hypothetical protein [Phycisphaerales bacterium]
MTGHVPISKRRVLINSISSVLATAMNLAILVWLQQYLLRRISPEEYSLYPVVASIMVFMPLLTMVLTGGIGRYIVEAYARGDLRRVTQIVSTMSPLLAAAGLLILAGGGALSWYVGKVLTIAPEQLWQARIMMFLMFASFSARLATAPYCVGLYANQKFVLVNAVNVGVQMLRIALLFALLFGLGPRVLWVVTATVAAELTGLAITQILSMRIMPSLRFRFAEIRWPLVRQLTSFGVWNLVGEVGYMIRQSSDPIVLNKLATPVDVNCFYVGFLAIRIVEYVLGPIILQMEPLLTGMHATGDAARLRNTYIRAGRYALWFGMLIALPLIVFHTEVLRLYLRETYETYRAAGMVMVLLLLCFPIAYGHVLRSRLASARAEVGPNARRVLFCECTNLALTLALVGYFRLGALGSALGTLTITAVLHPLLLWPLGLRMAGLTLRQWAVETVLPAALPALAGLAAWGILKFAVRPAGWLTLGACVAGGAVVYLGALLRFSLKEYERQDLSAVLAKIRGRMGGKA